MSKLYKLVTRPHIFFRDALRKRIGNNQQTKPVGKIALKKPAAGAKTAPRTLFFDGQLSLLNSLLMDGDYETLKKAWNHAYSHTTGGNERIDLLSLKAEYELSMGSHDMLIETANKLCFEQKNVVGHFYKAQSLFVRGDYRGAKHALQELLMSSPEHADGVYLLCDVTHQTGEKEIAWQALEKLALSSKRNKTWHAMASLVENDADLFRLLANWDNWKSKKVGPEFNKDVSEFIALGALRAGNNDLAKSIWRTSLINAAVSKGGFATLNVRKPSYSSRRAETALSDMNRVFEKANIELFLVSGTLLGCIREGRLLGHDKDIDVGIWDSVALDDLIETVTKSGLFFVLRSRSSEIIRLRHVNGIAIDVFYHFRTKDDYWHGGVKMVWHNKPFHLVRKEFLDESYLIPEDHDLYLTENYGDWKTPKVIFDSAFDTPNGEAINDVEMTVHTFKGLMDSCIDANEAKIEFYLERLNHYGESQFVDEFRACLQAVETGTHPI